MAKRKQKKPAPHENNPAPSGFESLDQALDWWRNKIRSGLPPSGLAAGLDGLTAASGTDLGGRQLAALEILAGIEIESCGALDRAPQVAKHLISTEERVFVASAAGGITCHARDSGKKLWSIPQERACQVGGMALADSVLFYTDSWHGKLYAAHSGTGGELWRADSASDGSPLLAPAGVAILNSDDTSLMIVSDSAAHRLCMFSLDGSPQGMCGRRGLDEEEIAHLNSAPADAAIVQYFEYPREVFAATDSDGSPAVFVWDSGNGRVVVLTAALERKRSVSIADDRDEVKPRIAGQVTVLAGPSGPVILVVDDARRVLSVRGSEGEQLLTYDLTPLMKSPRRKAESIRVDCGTIGSGGRLMAAGNGRLFRLPDMLLDPRLLAGNLLPLFPADCRLVPARLGIVPGVRKTVSLPASNWDEISPGLDPAALTACLLDEDDILSGRFERSVAVLESLTGSLDSGSMSTGASALKQAVSARLAELREQIYANLLRRCRPSAGKLKNWSDVRAEVDMELYQSRGRSSSAELRMDDELEQIRELEPSIRRLGWCLKAVHKLLIPRGNGSLAADIVEKLLDDLNRLLDERLESLAVIAGHLEYGRDPQRVHRDEIQAAHAADLRITALADAALVLSAEISRLAALNPAVLDGDRRETLAGCLKKSSGLACREILAGIDKQQLEPADNGGLTLPAVPELNGNTGECLRLLVNNMASYLKKLETAAEQGGKFGLVLQRQRHLFALKASVLSNFLASNDQGRELLEEARTIAGDAWRELDKLRPAWAGAETDR
ncbi:MAG: hypothetical protein FVQ81_00755 [Candidatus Glassbacteria bacterium]|nr:hypothetical protein [Candidatus Glassbacteria bacterium]